MKEKDRNVDCIETLKVFWNQSLVKEKDIKVDCVEALKVYWNQCDHFGIGSNSITVEAS